MTSPSRFPAAARRAAGFGEIPVLSEHGAPAAGPMRSDLLSDPESAGLLHGDLQMKSEGGRDTCPLSSALALRLRSGRRETLLLWVSEMDSPPAEGHGGESQNGMMMYITNICLFTLNIDKNTHATHGFVMDISNGHICHIQYSDTILSWLSLFFGGHLQASVN